MLKIHGRHECCAAPDLTKLTIIKCCDSLPYNPHLCMQVLNQASLGERNAIAESRFDSHTAAASRTRPSWDTAQSYDPRSSVYTSSDKSPAVSAVQEASDTAPQDRAGQGQADGLGDDDLSGGCFGSWHQTSQKVFSQASDAASLEFPGKASDIALPVVVHATRNQNSGGASSLPSDVKSGIDGDSLPSTGLDSGTAQKELLLELFDMVLANEVVRDRDVAMDKVQQLERELQAAMAAASAAAAAADNSGDSIRERDAALDKVQELERELQAMEAAAANNEGELTQARDAALAEVQQLEKELQAVREAAADSRTQVRQLKAEVRALNAVSADRYKQHRAAANATANQVWQLEAELQAVKAAAADSQGKMYAADDATLGQVQQVEKDLQNVRAAASEAGAKATTEPTALASPVVQLQTRPGVDEPKVHCSVNGWICRKANTLEIDLPVEMILIFLYKFTLLTNDFGCQTPRLGC